MSFVLDDAKGKPHHGLTVAGGVFGILAAFLAWYNALAGIADTSNRYVDPGLHVLMGTVAPVKVYRSKAPALIIVPDLRCFSVSHLISILTGKSLQFLHHSSCTLPMVRKRPPRERSYVRQRPQCLNNTDKDIHLHLQLPSSLCEAGQHYLSRLRRLPIGAIHRRCLDQAFRPFLVPYLDFFWKNLLASVCSVKN
jgi:GPR1/FUN34/yaaH family